MSFVSDKSISPKPIDHEGLEESRKQVQSLNSSRAIHNKARRNPGGRSKEKLFRLISKISFVLLFQFFACLFLIFAAEAVAGILGFLYRDRVGFFLW